MNAATSTPLAAEILSEDILREIIDQVWESLLQGPPIWQAPDGTFVADAGARIQILGEMPLLVQVRTSEAGAQAVTSTMLGLGPEEAPAAEDVADAMGEIVNVIGGNLKALLPAPSALGLPGLDPDPAGRAAGGLVAEVSMGWHGHVVGVTVHNDQPRPGAGEINEENK